MRTEKGKTVRKPCPFGFSGESLRCYLLLIHFPIIMLLVQSVNCLLEHFETAYVFKASAFHIQLFGERLSEKRVHATVPNGNMGYDQYTVPDDCSCRTYFCCFPLALTNIYPWPLVLFFQISLKNSELKTTHNSTYRDCRVHFFRHRFSKWLYAKPVNPLSETAFL